MRKVLAIAGKELRISLGTPAAGLLAAGFTAFSALWLFQLYRFVAVGRADFRPWFDMLPQLFVFLVPAMTMRAWAEERRSGTEEVLFSLPAGEGELFFGKFLGIYAQFTAMIALTVPLLVTLLPLGRFDTGRIVAEYAGILLFAAAAVAAGLLVSSVARSQISAFIGGMGFLFLLALSHRFLSIFPFPEWIGAAVRYAALEYRFGSFRRGVLDSRDIAYFLLVTAAFLGIGTKGLVLRKWGVESELRGPGREKILAALSLLVFVLAAGTTSLYRFRIDLTDTGMYSLSPVTRRALDSLPAETTVTYYISDRLRRVSPIPQDVIDVLAEYRALAGGRIRLRIVDPAENGEERAAMSYGIVPRQMQAVEGNRQSLETVYSGIVVHALDRHRTIPLVYDLPTLEYELTRAVRGAADPSREVIGVMIGDDDRTLSGDYSLLMQELGGPYEVREFPSGEEIDQDVSVLLVIGSRDIRTFELQAVERFMVRGGSVLFAADRIEVDSRGSFLPQETDASPLWELLASYGIEAEPSFLLDTFSRSLPLRTDRDGVIMDSMQEYPFWISIPEEGVPEMHPVTMRFGGLDLLWASPLRAEPQEGLRAVPLLRTTDGAWKESADTDTSPYRTAFDPPAEPDRRGVFPVGWSITGTLEPFFPAVREESGTEGEPMRAIVIGDADFLSDLVRYSESFYNFAFLDNAIRWLAGDEELLSIKTRPERDMRLNVVRDPLEFSRIIAVSELLNLVGIPLLILAAVWIRLLVHRRRSGGFAPGKGAPEGRR